MRKILQTLKLSWDEVGTLIGSVITIVLKREVTCRAALDDYNYWTVSDTAGRFSHDDLEILLDYVEASREIREITFHGDSDTTMTLDMGLSQALLKKKLNTSWEQELITEEGLWLVGIDPGHLNYAGTITVDGKIISMDNGQWDWYSIGGRWSDVFLVSDQCKEYSLGECGRAPREVPEGYIWVSAARKKDIEWDAMRSWRKVMAVREYEMLKSVFETKIIPDGTYCRILEDGVRSPSGREYLSGETEEGFLARYGLDGSDPRYPDCFYNYISGGEWFSSYGYGGDEKGGRNREEVWHDAVDDYIANLSDDTVLVVVDCHS